MDSRIRGSRASGPTGWLLTFLHARERGLRAHTGPAAGPAEWLLVFLEVESTELAARQQQRPATLISRRGKAEEQSFGRLTARSA
ncbi:hypothetical protein [Actinomadura sp. WMMB 499]|uniref:hypothetical protein n=1 Tax=Actinomadura sp. WMMB 499 TaxID=1219491 RepID=UPI00124618A4|nr:hypothetical protein [Actinomadura sp. WMMB 499]QFG22629.1 hypothetical protein F7P10_17405 [Actinomadura sp. WMMB 499]